MNQIYCASCGAKAIYEVVKPKFCGACTAPFDAAFAGAAAPQVTVTTVAAPVHRPQQAAAPVSRARAALSRLNVNQPPVQNDDPDEVEEVDADKEEIFARAEELAQTISPADFICGVDEGEAKKRTWSDILREVAANPPASTGPAPKARVSRVRRKT